jgi:hypothetical protein
VKGEKREKGRKGKKKRAGGIEEVILIMSVHLSTVSVRSHSIKCSEHAPKLSG